MNFHGEITYDTPEGGVHSDICFNCSMRMGPDAILDDDYRKFLHDCLDEWLNKSNGTGAFWLADDNYFKGWDGSNGSF